MGVIVVGSILTASVFVRHMHKGWWILMIPLALVVIGAIVELIKLIAEKREHKALVAEGVDPETVAKKAPTLR
jgi:predicted membrane channel-forming protein YqfA (hemolysin III family)